MSIIIPSSPADRKTIKDAMTEISNSMVRIESEKAFIKEAIEELNDKVDIDKKYLNKLARVYHKPTSSLRMSCRSLGAHPAGRRLSWRK